MKLSELESTRVELDNGLRLVAVPLPHVHTAVLDVYVRTGSRFERPDENGISHFLEHMLYRGIPDHPGAHQQALAFETLGGTLLAATAKDYGSMQISLPPERLQEVLPLVGEVFQSPLMTGIEIERGIVREEILETLDEAGTLIDADDLLADVAFPDHPLGLPITGSVERVRGFGESQLRRHHERVYVGRGTVVAVAGHLQVDEVLAELERVFRSVPEGVRASASAPAPQTSARFRFVEHAASQTGLRVGFRAPSFRDRMEPATQLVVRLLDDGLSTRLYEHLCDRHGLCYDVAACYEAYEDVGLVDLSAESANERAESVLDELLSVVNRLRDDGPTPEELDKAKRRHGWQLRTMLDDPEEVASHFGLCELGMTLQSPSARAQQLSDVTREQVIEAAQRVFQPSALNVVAVGAQSKRGEERLRRKVSDYA